MNILFDINHIKKIPYIKSQYLSDEEMNNIVEVFLQFKCIYYDKVKQTYEFVDEFKIKDFVSDIKI